MRTCRLCGGHDLAVMDTVLATKLKDCYTFDTTRFFPKDVVEIQQCLSCGLGMFGDAFPGDAAFYDALQSIPNYYESDKAEFQHAISWIREKRPASILDVGAGSGLFLKKLKDIPSLQVKASELSERSLTMLGKLGIEIDSPKDRYHFICSFQVFEHIEDLRGVLAFCDSKLKPGGHLLVSVPNADCALFRETFAYLDYPPHHVNRFTKQALESMARHLGYNLVDYWQERLRIEHYSSIVKGRRDKLLAAGNRGRWLRKKLGDLHDLLVLPALHGRSEEPGHSHTIVCRKPD